MGYRVFRLSRIKDPAILGKGFIKRKAHWRNYMEPQETTSPAVDLLLRFNTSVRYRMEDYFGEENIKESGGGRLETTISFPMDEWIYSFLLSFGDEIEVISPKHIRKGLRSSYQAGRPRKRVLISAPERRLT